MKDNSDSPIYVTAVPIPNDAADIGKFSRRSLLQREGSSYRLPSGKMSNDIRQNAVKQLQGQGFTKGMYLV